MKEPKKGWLKRSLERAVEEVNKRPIWLLPLELREQRLREMKEGLASKVPKDPHDWEQRVAHLIDPLNWFVLRDDLAYWICKKCANVVMNPPETLHSWGDCKKDVLA